MITSHGKVELFGSLKSLSYPAQIIPKTSCINVNQNKISIIPSVRVNILVVIDVNANIIEHPAAANIPIEIGSIPGLATNKIPQKPTKADPILTGVSFSERKNGAQIATQIGTENSNANN